MSVKIKENITNTMKNTFKNKNSIGLLVFAFILIGIGYYVFKTHIYPRLNPTYVSNKEFQKTDDETVTSKEPELANIYFYYTQWCPYCKKARPEWDKTKDKFEGKIINNNKLQFHEIDCDSKTNAEMVKDIDGYPTIKMFLPDGKTVEYDSKPDSKTLELFINSVLNE